MEEVAEKLPAAHIYIPAGVYGARQVPRPQRALPVIYAFGLTVESASSR